MLVKRADGHSRNSKAYHILCAAYYARRTSKKEYSVRKGIQALLRSQMISEYNKWSERGYAPIYARESFENCWQQYHALGANGVMDDIHERFLLLPTKEKED